MFHWPLDPAVSPRPGWWRRGGPRSTGFASARGGGRLHAACDLVVTQNTEVRAITNGTILRYTTFYDGTWQVTVSHEHTNFEPFIVRYGEVHGPDQGGIRLNVGDTVVGGNTIARVGRLDSTGASMLHFELYATTQWPFPSLSLANRWRRGRAPVDYSQAERNDIRRGGWHPDFQRRLDLADPTDFLLALQRGQTPTQPTPNSSSGQVVQMQAIRVTPSDEFLRERAALLEAIHDQARREEQLREWYSRHGRLIETFGRDSGFGNRRPGPLDPPHFRRVPCEYYWYDRYGPD